jgi:predicted transcriptional regulator
MNVLLSIKPKYASKIMEGTKKYEFRKSIFKQKTVDMVYIYSSYPVKKIIGKFTVGDILEDHPDNLWDTVQNQSGLNESEFFNYFQGKSKGFAIEIDEFTSFKNPIDPKLHFDNFIPPQSFRYVTHEFEELCHN